MMPLLILAALLLGGPAIASEMTSDQHVQELDGQIMCLEVRTELEAAQREGYLTRAQVESIHKGCLRHHNLQSG